MEMDWGLQVTPNPFIDVDGNPIQSEAGASQDFQFSVSLWPCMIPVDTYYITIVNTFYGGINIILVWVCQMGKKMGTLAKVEKH